MTSHANTIVEYINRGEEFKYIKLASKMYNCDFMELCNHSLDFYNYQRRQGLDTMGSKIMALSNMCDYAQQIGNYRGKR